MASRSTPEIVAGILLVGGAVVGGVIGVIAGSGPTDHLSAVVRCLAGAAIGGALTVIALGLSLFFIEGIKTLGGRPSNEPTLSDVASIPTATPASLADARMYAIATVACLVIGAFSIRIFALVLVMWFVALVFALLARRASGDDIQWRRATTVLYVATIVALIGLFVSGSGLVGG